MTSRTRRRIRRWMIAGAGLAAVGVWVGYYKVAFYLPGMTAHRLRKLTSSGGAA